MHLVSSLVFVLIYPYEVHKDDIYQKLDKSPKMYSKYKWESSLNYNNNQTQMFMAEIVCLLTVETNNNAARRTKNAGSSLANWAFVS